MATIANSVEIARPIDDVFDFLSDPSNEPLWNSAVKSISKLTDGPVRVGTQYRAMWIDGKSPMMVCTRYERPSGWSDYIRRAIAINRDFDLDPTDKGTKLLVRIHLKPQRWFLPIFILLLPAYPLVLWVLRRREGEKIQHIKRVLESREPAALLKL